jgi:hypothetical protein
MRPRILDALRDRADGARHVVEQPFDLPPHELHVLGRRGPFEAEHSDFERPADQMFSVGGLLPAEVFRRKPTPE